MYSAISVHFICYLKCFVQCNFSTFYMLHLRPKFERAAERVVFYSNYTPRLIGARTAQMRVGARASLLLRRRPEPYRGWL